MTPVWTPRALQDLGDVIRHIAENNPEAAAELADQVIGVVETTLSDQPGTANLFTPVRRHRAPRPSGDHFEGVAFPKIECIGAGVTV